MTMSDIRELERQTQEALRKKMANSRRDAGEEDDGEDYDHEDSRESVKESPFICTKPSSDSSCDDKKSDNSSRSWAGDKGGGGAGEYYETSRPKSPKITVKISDLGDNIVSTPSTSKSISCSGKGHHSSPRAAKKVEASRTWRVEGLMKNESDSEGSDDEFFDCLGNKLTRNCAINISNYILSHILFELFCLRWRRFCFLNQMELSGPYPTG